MKTMSMFAIASLVIVMGSLGGCTTTKVKVMGEETIGDKKITFVGAEWVNPCAGNGLSILAFETKLPQQPQCAQVQTTPVHYGSQPEACMRGHAHTQEHPMRVQQCVTSSGQDNTQLINANDSATTGLVNGAFQGSVQGAFMAGGMIIGAGRIRPSNVSAGGGSASASATAAAAAATGGGTTP